MEKYYLGLDIGTDSVGYAVTDEYYQLIKRRGEPVYGVQTFDAASPCAERRAFRTGRRRIDRRQQRVELLSEIFAADIGRKDPRFFIRRAESRLYRDEAGDDFPVFNDKDYTDANYYRQYPTIHHLICELMENHEPHDIRLVYLACAWLVAHRGHFLFDVATDDISELSDFGKVYEGLKEYLSGQGLSLPWSESVTPDALQEVLTMRIGTSKKQTAFTAKIYNGKKPAKLIEEDFPYSKEAVMKLLCGSSLKPFELTKDEALAEAESVSLGMDEEDFMRITADLGDAGDFLRELRRLTDCALLIVAQNGRETVSQAKVDVYEQHKTDLANLKKFVKKYIPQEYDSIFRAAAADNYTAYSYNVKSCKDKTAVGKKANAEIFLKFLKGKVSKVKPEPEDEAFFVDMLTRLETFSFLPKQKTTDNRVIPQQLYRYELEQILNNASAYLPILNKKDETGLTGKEKILSIFDFRIPYYVGPLCKYGSKNAWIERKGEGKIYPWNFTKLVNLDASEEAFISRMTNKCTYLAGEDVLPVKSLLYSRFTVLNEINNLKVNGKAIPVEIKQRIFTELFMAKPRVTAKDIKTFLKANGCLFEGDEITGIDIKINSSLASYHWFKNFLDSGKLSESEVEDIIRRTAFSEDKTRFIAWLRNSYPKLNNSDCKEIVHMNLKEFGRLSRAFLDGITAACNEAGEARTIIEAMWETNCNLMQLLSGEYSYAQTIEELNREYYSAHPEGLSERLSEMYISNAVKRPIIRTLDICGDVVKAMGCPPEKIFIEMARGASPDQKGKRTRTRKQQLEELYKTIKTDEARALEKELADMGLMADNRLQSDRLFLYYLQMGKCAYTGRPIDITRLADGTYNIEHIYPRSLVKDDSITDNKVLVESEINGVKSDIFPVPAEIRSRMRPVWEGWKAAGLISAEKFTRLTRSTPFTDAEKMAFINRQLVETRQSTKAVAQLLGEKYAQTQIVYVKAGLVSEFRQEFDMLKSRQVNNLHHAKDAYLNIVVGNVYDSRFSKQYFRVSDKYTLKTRELFIKPVKCGSRTVWQGEKDIAKVRTIMNRNCIHVTRYAYCRKGGLFDQMPVKKGAGLVPLKSGLDTEKYGGYNKPAAAFFALVKYVTDKKTDAVFLPVELLNADKFSTDSAYAERYAKDAVARIIGKPVHKAEIMLGGRALKINTVLSLDGLLVAVNGKSGGGRQLIVSLVSPLILSAETERYIKCLESFSAKRAANSAIQPDEEHDHISAEANLRVYEQILQKLNSHPYNKCPGNPYSTLCEGKDKFCNLAIDEQCKLIMNLMMWFSPASATIDLSALGGAKKAGAKYPSSSLSSFSGKYTEVRIVDSSASGIYNSYSENLLALL